jgi:hypothetical protein
MQTFYVDWPEDGSQAEFDSLAALITNNITKKIDKILSQRLVTHAWGSDSRQMIIIREYEKIEDLVVSDDTRQELVNAYWKTEEEREAFNKAYSKYWNGHHSDEIYQEMPASRK